ncbi:MAG: PKD domain-containing protein [Flavobacteriales bacterium]
MENIKLKCVIILLQFSLFSYSQVFNVCSGDTVDFNSQASNPNNFIEWEFVLDNGANVISGQNSENLKVYFDNPGSYILQFREYSLTDCYGLVEQIIEVYPNPLADFTNGSICIFDSVNFINNSTAIDGIQSSIWRIDDFIYSGIDLTYTFSAEGEYVIELSIESSYGCSNQTSVVFKLSDKPQANFYHSPQSITTLDPQVTFINSSYNGDKYTWSFGDDFSSNDYEPTHDYSSAGWFDVQLVIEDQLGCKDSITKSLLVENELIYYLPTSFTPDGDGINDFFGISGYRLKSLQEFRFEINDRWGQRIYATEDINAHWDGKVLNGGQATSGVYIWSIVIKDELGKVTKEIGEVTLLR